MVSMLPLIVTITMCYTNNGIYDDDHNKSYDDEDGNNGDRCYHHYHDYNMNTIIIIMNTSKL